MGMFPGEMERWGAASIFKESASLLHKHYRLFLPFCLAFYFPISIVTVFETLFLSTPSSTPLLGASTLDGSAVNTAQIPDPPGGLSFTTIFSWTLYYFLMYVIGTLGAGAVFYITNSLYTPTRTRTNDDDDDDDNRSFFPKVFRILPSAFLRMFITELWTLLAFLLLCLFYSFLVGILYAILYAAGWSDFPLLLLFSLLPFSILFFCFAMAIALAQIIAVLEPGNYGREALKRSTKLVRIGRMWTIVAVVFAGLVLPTVLSFLKDGIMSGGMPMWAKIVLGVGIAGVDSVNRVYLGVVSVVMYFVYKARFDAAAAASAEIPVFKRIDSAEHSYEPIVEGKGSVTYHIGEP